MDVQTQQTLEYINEAIDNKNGRITKLKNMLTENLPKILKGIQDLKRGLSDISSSASPLTSTNIISEDCQAYKVAIQQINTNIQGITSNLTKDIDTPINEIMQELKLVKGGGKKKTKRRRFRKSSSTFRRR